MVLHTGPNKVTVSRTTVSLSEANSMRLCCHAYALADKYNDATAKFDQTVSVNGAVVSTLSTGTAPRPSPGIRTY